MADPMDHAWHRSHIPKLRRFNLWTCSACGKDILGEDIDDGVTPFMLACRCGGEAVSAFYRIPAQTREPDIIWRKPTRDEYAGLSNAMREHVDQGGLIMEDRRG